MQAATAAGLPPEVANRVQASARAAFSRAKNREVATKGRMLVVRLNIAATDGLRVGGNARLAECRQWLIDNEKYAVVKAATIFQIERSSSDTQVADQIISDIKANLSGLTEQQIASVSAAIDRTVKEQIRTALADRYVVWATTWIRPEDR
ncbi:hypothetical protein [Brevundimonas diminuta]|uniref:hypothetical protein n=1 Tax=Brevundimonas diminuta TaxID=293 RepID=UPI0025A61505|nr:hypothetical protein [Brevundimonas diminuta]MDM8354001.1 hypothetical protein [Brevundimonas diminuta]